LQCAEQQSVPTTHASPEGTQEEGGGAGPVSASHTPQLGSPGQSESLQSVKVSASLSKPSSQIRFHFSLLAGPPLPQP
jgi:hypothetical protein